eukprot:scpid76980/ scgid15679/ Mitogen-activated protein kinase kinase kinase 6; Apoptosis signal-regulating kinase 2
MEGGFGRDAEEGGAPKRARQRAAASAAANSCGSDLELDEYAVAAAAAPSDGACGGPEDLLYRHRQPTRDVQEWNRPSPYAERYFFSERSGEQYNTTRRCLGSGEFACVVVARSQSTFQDVAIKINNQAKGQIENEITINEKLEAYGGSENICFILDVVATENPGGPPHRHIVMPIYGKTLQDYLISPSQGMYVRPASVKKEMTRQLFSGLAYIHDHNIVHSDLSFTNTLVDFGTGQLKITDFGHSTCDNETMCDKLTDIGNLTCDVVLPFWLATRVTRYRKDLKQLLRSDARFCPVANAALPYACPDDIACLAQVVSRYPDPTGMLSPIVQECVMYIHNYILTHPMAGDGGTDIPSALHGIMSLGLLCGRHDELDARYISDLLEAVCPHKSRARAQQYIKANAPPEPPPNATSDDEF